MKGLNQGLKDISFVVQNVKMLDCSLMLVTFLFMCFYIPHDKGVSLRPLTLYWGVSQPSDSILWHLSASLAAQFNTCP